jgi:hypothetical protein
MKSFSFAKALTLGCLVCLTLPVACGDDDDSGTTKPGTGGESGSPSTGDAGAGGMAAVVPPLPPGISTMASTKECGAEMCKSVGVGPAVFVDPCCSADDACGLNTGFLSLVGAQFADVCQAKDQPGDEDTSCATAEGLIVPFQMGTTTLMIPLDPFAGCCREDGTCGVVVNKATSGGGKIPIADFGFGCMDGAPFFKGKVTKCGGGGIGGDGAGGGSSVGGASDAGGNGAATGGAGGNPL